MIMTRLNGNTDPHQSMTQERMAVLLGQIFCNEENLRGKKKLVKDITQSIFLNTEFLPNKLSMDMFW
jgi:fructose-specific component phosphotransferase system IIB-like protein